MKQPAPSKRRATGRRKIRRRLVRPRKPAARPRRPGPAAELAALRENLRVAQETLDAIRSGEVDAVIVKGANGDQVYSLAGAEQPYRVYIERMQEGAVTVSAEGLILYCNRRFAEMLGRPLEKVISSSLADHIGATAWSHLRSVFTGDGQEFVKYEGEILPRRGDPLAVSLTASHLQLDGPSLMCLVVTDLTASREQENLRLARDVAEKASAAKDDFLAALSHELRTPLTPALMTATVLEKDTTLPVAARAAIAMIRRNVELEARLIDDLLDLTLIQHGKLSLQPGTVDLHACLARALEVVDADARAKHITFEVALDAGRTRFGGDPVRVQQVCWNVLRNAVKFTPERGTIAIRTGNDGANDAWLRVTDSGIGFNAEQGARIFDAFEQGSRHITRQFGGLGLGLAITRSIMQAHGGHIEGASPGPGRGATFTIRFPLTSAAPSQPAASAPAAAARSRSLRILLVEDHKDTRLTIQRLLEAVGHRVVSAPTAALALDLAEHAPFDLVISDLGLPDLTGHELMHRLHTRFGLPGLALSGYGMEHDLAQSQAAGFRHHLTKPVSFDQLKTFVAQFTTRPDTAAPVVSASA